jgi:hypothetical protein
LFEGFRSLQKWNKSCFGFYSQKLLFVAIISKAVDKNQRDLSDHYGLTNDKALREC